MASASTMPGARRYSPTKTNRSKVRKTNLFGELRRSTLICYRRTRISASSRPLERNKLVSAVHSSMRTSTIGHEHHPIRPASQLYRVYDKDRSAHAPHELFQTLVGGRRPSEQSSGKGLADKNLVQS